MKNIRIKGEFISLIFALVLVLILSFIAFKIEWWILVGLVVIQLIYILLQQKQVQGTSILVSEEQFPIIYKIVVSVSNKFNISVPDVYIQYDPYINAYVMGFKKPYILVLTSSLVEAMNDEELAFAIGHEMGHIKMGHARLKSFVFPLDRNIFLFTFLFNSWLRKTEYTADRCGLYFSTNLKACANSLLKLTIGAKLYSQINIKAVVKQLKISNDEKIEKVSETLLDHPFTTNRIIKLAEFDGKTIDSI
jgi:Zn-dependent protease with chaperone function